MTPNEGRVYFSLAGYNFSPEDVTKALGLEPTMVNRDGVGQPLDKPIVSVWEISTDKVVADVDIFAMTDALIKTLDPAKEKILEVIERYNLSAKLGVSLLLSVDKNQTTPEVGFRGRSLRFLTDIGALIDIDYQLSERIGG